MRRCLLEHACAMLQRRLSGGLCPAMLFLPGFSKLQPIDSFFADFLHVLYKEGALA